MTPDPTVHIVAVHGNGCGAFRFRMLPRVLREGSGSNPEVILTPITLPGFEGMPLPPDPDASTFVTAIANEIAHLRRHRPADRLVLLGHGVGGTLVLDAIARAKVEVAAAIVHAPAGPGRPVPRLLRLRPVREAMRLAVGSRAAGALGPRLLFEGRVPRAYTKRFLAEYRRCEAFAVMFDLPTSEWFDRLPAIDTPTALVWGSADRIRTPDGVTAFEAKLGDHRTVIVEGWGHYPMIEQPVDYAARIAGLASELTS